VAKGLQGLHRRHRYPGTVSCYTMVGDARNGFPCTTPAWKEDLLKAGVTRRRAIFLAGNPLTNARVLWSHDLVRCPRAHTCAIIYHWMKCQSVPSVFHHRANVVKIMRPRFYSRNFEVKVVSRQSRHVELGCGWASRLRLSFLNFQQFQRDLSRERKRERERRIIIH